MLDENREYEIRVLAYELWEKAGGPAGKHLEFWIMAEKELKREPGAESASGGTDGSRLSPSDERSGWTQMKGATRT